MTSYRDYFSAPKAQQANTFESQLRKAMDARSRTGTEGMDLNEGYGGKRKAAAKDMIYRNFVMNDAVFDLGCKLAENHSITPHAWVNWMSDAELDIGFHEARVYHRNKFFCEGVQKRFHGMLADYYKLPLRFISDIRIERRVAA